MARFEVEAHGVADAEAQVEKELRRALPGARIDIREVKRLGDDPRIVETFALAYRVRLDTSSTADTADAARRELLRALRADLVSSRFSRLAWDRVDLRPIA